MSVLPFDQREGFIWMNGKQRTLINEDSDISFIIFIFF